MLLHLSVNNLPVNERYRLEILHLYQPEFLPFIMPLTTIEGYGKNSNIAFRITPSKLTYYRTMANGITEMGSELDERGLTIRAIGDNPTTRYSVDEIRNSNYTGVGSFKLPRNTTIRSF